MFFAFLAVFATLLTHIYAQFYTACNPLVTTGITSSSPFQNLLIGSVNIVFLENKTQNLEEKIEFLKPQQFRSYSVVAAPSFLNNYFDPSALYIVVRAVKRQGFFLVRATVSQSATLTFIRVQYIVSNRQDIIVGTFSADHQDFKLSGTSSDTISSKKYDERVANFTTQLEKKINAPSENVFVKTFISGVRTDDRFAEIEIIKTSFGFKNNTITVTLRGKTCFQCVFDIMIISYMVLINNDSLNLRQTPFTTQQILVSLSQQKTNNEAIVITGIASKNVTELNVQTSRTILETPIVIPQGSRLLAQVDVSRQSFNKFDQQFDIARFSIEGTRFLGDFSTIQITLSYGDITNKIKQLTTPYRCVSLQTCKEIGGSVYVDPDTNIAQCIFCRPNSQFSFKDKRCNCLPGYVDDSQRNCVQNSNFCRKGQKFINGKCYKLAYQIVTDKCRQNFIFDVKNRKCLCRPGYISYISTQRVRKCVESCIKGHVFDAVTQTCICPTQRVDKDGYCIPCQLQTSKWNEKQKRCECLPKFKRAYGGERCFACSEFATYNIFTQDCECKTGYRGDGVDCISNSQTERTPINLPVIPPQGLTIEVSDFEL